MWAIAKAALRAIFKSPQAIFFSLFFPIVLIMVFGAIGGGGGISIDVGFDSKTDTTNGFYKATIPCLMWQKELLLSWKIN